MGFEGENYLNNYDKMSFILQENSKEIVEIALTYSW